MGKGMNMLFSGISRTKYVKEIFVYLHVSFVDLRVITHV
jgi:hypothetical protein